MPPFCLRPDCRHPADGYCVKMTSFISNLWHRDSKAEMLRLTEVFGFSSQLNTLTMVEILRYLLTKKD